MCERPILFSGPMVRAIIDGRKTQTRRVVKPQPRNRADIGSYGHGLPFIRADPKNVSCPYGQIGDRLWVRETWRIGAWDEHDGRFCIDYCDGPRKEWLSPDNYIDEGEQFNRLWQQSTDDAHKAFGAQDRYEWEPGASPCRWRPSIHMPRWASRITLEITGVRVERLNDISEADAKSEGASFHDGLGIGHSGWRHDFGDVHADARSAFARLWDSINGAGSWDANPWVWVIEFRRIQ